MVYKVVATLIDQTSSTACSKPNISQTDSNTRSLINPNPTPFPVFPKAITTGLGCNRNGWKAKEYHCQDTLAPPFYRIFYLHHPFMRPPSTPRISQSLKTQYRTYRLRRRHHYETPSLLIIPSPSPSPSHSPHLSARPAPIGPSQVLQNLTTALTPLLQNGHTSTLFAHSSHATMCPQS